MNLVASTEALNSLRNHSLEQGISSWLHCILNLLMPTFWKISRSIASFTEYAVVRRNVWDFWVTDDVFQEPDIKSLTDGQGQYIIFKKEKCVRFKTWGPWGDLETNNWSICIKKKIKKLGDDKRNKEVLL